MAKTIQKVTSTATLAIVTFVTYFGIFFCTQMMMTVDTRQVESIAHVHHNNNGCDTFMTKGCTMDVFEHLAIWSERFTATFSAEILSTFLIIFVALAIACTFGVSLGLGPSITLRLYARRHRQYKLYNYFQELFSSGTLQPKLLA